MDAADGASAGNGQDGNGAPSGGSPEGGSENDDKPITAKQLKAALASQARQYEERLSGQAREFEAFKAGGGGRKEQAEPPKRYTRAELRAAVEANQITAEQSDDIWAKQVREESREDAIAAATDVVTSKATKERIDADLTKYKRLKPEIMQAGSETRDKIVEEFNYLKSIGDPGTIETELKAIRAVLGPLDKLEKAAGARRSEESEEQGGSDSGGGQRKNTSKKLVDHLNADAKAKYQERINKGLYKDWDAVEKELAYASRNVRQRLGLPA